MSDLTRLQELVEDSWKARYMLLNEEVRQLREVAEKAVMLASRQTSVLTRLTDEIYMMRREQQYIREEIKRNDGRQFERTDLLNSYWDHKAYVEDIAKNLSDPKFIIPTT